MTYPIELSATANQKLTVNLDGSRYSIKITLGNGCTLATIERDGVAVVSGQRIVAGEPIIPYKYLEAGNFILVTADDLPPDYTKFGTDQILYYVTQEEVDASRSS
jgi:hypothetical protein